MFVDESLIHNHYAADFVQLSVAKRSSGENRNAHRGEVIRAYDANSRNGTFRYRYLWLAENVDSRRRSQSGQRRIILHAYGSNTGNATNACQQLFEESHLKLVFAILGTRQRYLERKQVPTLKSRVNPS